MGIGPGREVLLQLDNSTANADGDGLSAITSAEFFHDVLDVNFHGFFGDE